MAKKIILLNKLDNNLSVIKLLFWAEVPPARQAAFASPGLQSIWSGASQAENDAIAAGQITETLVHIVPIYGFTLQQTNALIQERWQEYQDQITNNTIMFKPGTYYDGTWHPA